VKIAILGGTFDPIHNGHLALAQAVVDTFEVDALHFVPAFAPPHKSCDGITSPFHRFAMAALATVSDERFLLSTIEADRLEPRYSVDTLELMRQEYPEASLLFITGTDMYQDIEEWKDYERLFTLASFAVVNRPGFPMREDVARFETLGPEARIPLGGSPSVYYLPWVDQDVSSTQIRRAVCSGGLDRWVPPAVAAYIRKHRLYKSNLTH